jgi:probable O-glycosylation ligase (exosortase A-associated)
MPENWFDKMESIANYQQDTSAMGRLNAWSFAVNLAKDRPLTGGGFETFTPGAFQRWAPDPSMARDAHSIWFEVLGEHGFVGLALFVLLWVLTWMLARSIIRSCKSAPELRWARDLAAMVQVSLIGYWVGGTFLGLAYFDLPYVLMSLLVLTKVVLERERQRVANGAPTSASPIHAGAGSHR